ncbi:MaoC family dehydratase [Campylobacter peloridis]|uniref:MaoC family dehydratase n=1 Tax=Campylobacter peloridis TaxID=488546 RepID=A0A5C7DL42_9BACT|nr:MaoC family dehydratase [Campylobacter peloridis]TXE81325.1 MaoC family dehydratase [Campylobacter peloridis]
MKFSNINKSVLDKIQIGMSESYIRLIKEVDVRKFAKLSGDNNPIHLDEEYAQKSRYKRRIAHGLFCASFFSALFGMKLPGKGCVYVSQTLNFKRPIYINDEVEAKIEVFQIDKAKSKIYFKTTCKVKNKIAIDGEAEIFLP